MAVASRLPALIGRQLIHTCTVTSVTPTGPADRDGQPTWVRGAATTGVRCRLRDRDRAEVVDATEAGTLTIAATMQVPRDAAVAERYEVKDIRLAANGVVIDAGSYRVAEVLTKRAGAGDAFKVLTLERA